MAIPIPCDRGAAGSRQPGFDREGKDPRGLASPPKPPATRRIRLVTTTEGLLRQVRHFRHVFHPV